MKRFTTLILMLTIMLTFTQKATALASVLSDDSSSMTNCTMVMMSDNINTSEIKCDSKMMSAMTDCPSDCNFMTVISVLHFIDHIRVIVQPQSRLAYQSGTTIPPYYFPESLYRPPFLS